MSAPRSQKSRRKGLPDIARYAVLFLTSQYAYFVAAAEMLHGAGLAPVFHLPSRPQVVPLVPLPLPKVDFHPIQKQGTSDSSISKENSSSSPSFIPSVQHLHTFPIGRILMLELSDGHKVVTTFGLASNGRSKLNLRETHRQTYNLS